MLCGPCDFSLLQDGVVERSMSRRHGEFFGESKGGWGNGGAVGEKRGSEYER